MTRLLAAALLLTAAIAAASATAPARVGATVVSSRAEVLPDGGTVTDPQTLAVPAGGLLVVE